MGSPIENFDIRNWNDYWITSLYNQQYHTNQWEVFRQRNLNAAKIFHDNIKFNSVVDFGCGIGSHLEYFLWAGCEIRGYEYCYDQCRQHINKVANLEKFISFGDVSKRMWAENDKLYDVSMSLEVAEHIPEQLSDNLVNNLCCSSRQYIIFTAAQLGQGGTGHINCQNPMFWIEKFNSRGWFLNQQLIEKIKGDMIPQYSSGENTYPIVWSFIYNNLMIFQKAV